MLKEFRVHYSAYNGPFGEKLFSDSVEVEAKSLTEAQGVKHLIALTTEKNFPGAVVYIDGGYTLSPYHVSIRSGGKTVKNFIVKAGSNAGAHALADKYIRKNYPEIGNHVVSITKGAEALCKCLQQ